MKRIVSLFFGCLLIFSFRGMVFAEDVNHPVLNGIIFDKETYHGGDTINITADVTDDNSGIDYVFFYVQSPSKTQNMNGYAVKQPDGTYLFSRTLNPYAEEGNWKIIWFETEDKANNQKAYYDGIDIDLGFTVINPNADITKPTLDKIELGKTEVMAGESLPITVKASDDLSGVNGVAVTAEHPSGQTAYLQISEKDANGNWSGELYIKETAASGTWNIRYVSVGDKAHNGNLNEVNIPFYVTNPSEDLKAPVLDQVLLDKTEVNAGENLKLTVKAHDDKSGINYINASLWMNMVQFINVRIDQKDENGDWSAVIPIPEEAKLGKWQVGYIQFYDKAGNQKLYVNDQDYTSYFTVVSHIEVIRSLLSSVEKELGKNIDEIDTAKISEELQQAKQKIDLLTDEAQKTEWQAKYETLNQKFNELLTFKNTKTQFENMLTSQSSSLDEIEGNIGIFMAKKKELAALSTINEDARNELIAKTRSFLADSLIQYLEENNSLQQKLSSPTVSFMVEYAVAETGATSSDDKNEIMHYLMPVLSSSTTGKEVIDAISEVFNGSI